MKTGKDILIIKTIALQVKNAFELSQLTQQEFAEALGTTQPHVSNILKGNHDIGVTMLTKIAITLDCEFLIPNKC